MIRVSRWKIALVVLAALFGVYFSLPNLFPAGHAPAGIIGPNLNLGLDLQGGSSLLLEVDTAALQRERVTNLIEDVRRTLRDARIVSSGLRPAADGASVQINDPAQLDAARRALGPLDQALDNGAGRTLAITSEEGSRLRLTFTREQIEYDGRRAVDQSIEVIRRRVDELGTREPSIVRQGANRIVVQAPGESDPERLKRVIGQTARLSFQMVDETVPIAEAAAGRLPPGVQLLPQVGRPEEPALVVQRRALVTGEMLTSASLGRDEGNQPTVNFRFNTQGARAFGRATTANVGKRFAIVLDGRIISAPTIQTPITGGEGRITGNFTDQSANDLALLLRAGALPAPLNVEEQRTVGAELGADAVHAGQISALLGFVAIVIFMIGAYGFLFGGISVIGLIVNGLLIVALMSVSQATLTLPGIAGLILTLAVAVDANVLIYERMREEARAGRSVIQAMESGFSRAMVTIIDANVTTLAAAAIMFVFGAGPVRGFAWTLSIGVFTSVFSAVMVSQVLLGLWYRQARPKKLPIV